MKNIPIVIPSYEPDERLLKLLSQLNDNCLGPVIIVNDGSDNQYDDIFNKAEEIVNRTGGIILKHEINKGKGRALKTAFEYIIVNMPEAIGVVTADSDGQHTPQSISNVMNCLSQYKENLILGVRKFDGDGIPWKSRFGNNLTEMIFKYISGVHISDTQTGLRGIPMNYMRELIDLQGEGFEFEMRMLLDAAGRYDITEVNIETIYDSEKNHQTHFNPLRDSIRIYRILGEKFVKFIFSSLSSSLLDLLLFSILCLLLKNRFPRLYIMYATVGARLVSSSYNYLMNYKVVFRSNESIAKSGIKYLVLVIVQMVLSAILVSACVYILTVVPEVLYKIIVDTILFFISYHLQQKFVFANK